MISGILLAIFELSDIDLVGAPTNVSALARMEVRVLPLGILITLCVIKMHFTLSVH